MINTFHDYLTVLQKRFADNIIQYVELLKHINNI